MDGSYRPHKVGRFERIQTFAHDPRHGVTRTRPYRRDGDQIGSKGGPQCPVLSNTSRFNRRTMPTRMFSSFMVVPSSLLKETVLALPAFKFWFQRFIKSATPIRRCLLVRGRNDVLDQHTNLVVSYPLQTSVILMVLDRISDFYR